MYTEEVNKITLSSDDDETWKTFDGIETYQYGKTNEILKVFEAKMWKVKNVCKRENVFRNMWK